MGSLRNVHDDKASVAILVPVLLIVLFLSVHK